jgi:hypothetical protein
MLTEQSHPKGWSQVFVDGHGLVEALVSVYEGVNEVGILGGNLRSLYADFLKEAAKITGRPLAESERAYRKAAESWDEFGSVCLEVPVVSEIIDLHRQRRNALRHGDQGWDEAMAAGLRSARLMEADAELGDGERRRLFERMAETLRIVHGNEVSALEALAGAVGF